MLRIAPLRSGLRTVAILSGEVQYRPRAPCLLAMLAETIGHETIIEHQSRKALARAMTEQPDVCLLDLGLPDLDGYELARQLRSAPKTAKSILIAVTGYSDQEAQRKSKAAGFDHHRVKPLEITDLIDIFNVINERQQNQHS